MAGRYKVGEIMVDKIVVATPDESIYNCARKMAHRKIGSLIVVDETTVAGIITEQDIARKVVAKGLVARATPVSTIMSNDVTSISPQQEIEIAMDLMSRNQIKHLPVIEQGELIGIITAKDIVAIEPILIEMLKFNNSGKKETINMTNTEESMVEAEETFNFSYNE